jgi:hypothetical protein
MQRFPPNITSGQDLLFLYELFPERCKQTCSYTLLCHVVLWLCVNVSEEDTATFIRNRADGECYASISHTRNNQSASDGHNQTCAVELWQSPLWN